MRGFASVLREMPPGLMSRMAQLEHEQRLVDQHPAVVELKRKYPDLQNKVLPNDYFQYAQSHDNCQKCQGLEQCPSIMKGHRLIIEEDEVLGPVFKYSSCELQKGWEMQQKINRYVKGHHVKEHILRTTFKDLDLDTRTEAIKAAMRFCTTFEKGKTTKGLYLYGSWGVGKSAIAGAMTQELAKRGIDVIMVYVPDFLEEIKDSIKEGGMEKKLEAMKNVSVLIFDDIGAESLSGWTRDGVIGRILNSRMEKLPTVYTSNLSLDELHHHLIKGRNDKEDRNASEKKANRLMERIEPFVQVYQVVGRNRRRDKTTEMGA